MTRNNNMGKIDEDFTGTTIPNYDKPTSKQGWEKALQELRDARIDLMGVDNFNKLEALIRKDERQRIIDEINTEIIGIEYEHLGMGRMNNDEKLGVDAVKTYLKHRLKTIKEQV